MYGTVAAAGVLLTGSGSPMIGADMVIGRMADAKPQVCSTELV